MNICFLCCDVDPDKNPFLDCSDRLRLDYDWTLECILKELQFGAENMFILVKNPDFIFWFFNCLLNDRPLRRWKYDKVMRCGFYAALDEDAMQRYREIFHAGVSRIKTILYSGQGISYILENMR